MAKKLILSTLLLLISLTTQVKSYFVRGAIYEKDGQYRRVFDSYGDPFLKSIEWKAIPMQVKRFWIEKKSTPPLSGKESLYAKIIRWFTNLLKK